MLLLHKAVSNSRLLIYDISQIGAWMARKQPVLVWVLVLVIMMEGSGRVEE